MPTGATAASIESLPELFSGPNGLGGSETRFRISAGRTVRDVVVTGDACRVTDPEGDPDTEIATDPDTWKHIYSGRLSGIEAFSERRLTVRGSIELALMFEPLFDRPAAGGLTYELQHVELGGLRLSTLLAGDAAAPPLLLVHGLGATKASWLPVVPELSRRHRVIALDLPGFGASSKPRGRYDARWFSDHVFGMLDELGHERTFVAGNSLGGRIAQEMALQEPKRVEGIACLAPATAFTHRPLLWLARLARPELAMLLGRLPRQRMQQDLRTLFAAPDRIQDEWYEAAIDDFLRTWRDPRARLAVSCALRQIYLEEPYGDAGFWRRLTDLEVPALYIFGAKDTLITHRFAAKVASVVPAAEVQVWDDCGHVPQLECSERTVETMVTFFEGIHVPARAGGSIGSEFRHKLTSLRRKELAT